jgi:Pyruvate kinase, barrel domain
MTVTDTPTELLQSLFHIPTTPCRGRAKIVCTLGPATASTEGISALVAAGMDVARLNLSHGDQADHHANYQRVRAASDASGRAVGILTDLQGPKMRLGRFAEGPPYGRRANTSASPSTTAPAPTTGCPPPTPILPTTRAPAINCWSTTA